MYTYTHGHCTYIHLSISLSLSIYIYIYMHSSTRRVIGRAGSLSVLENEAAVIDPTRKKPSELWMRVVPKLRDRSAQRRASARVVRPTPLLRTASLPTASPTPVAPSRRASYIIVYHIILCHAMLCYVISYHAIL